MVPGGKGNLTDDGTNVPLICGWPGRIQPGQVVDDLFDFSDFLPTFAELAHATSDEPAIDGVSFARRLTDNRPGPRKWAFAQHQGKHWVRTHRWKLYSDGRFYDLKNDPHEQQNLAESVPNSPDYQLLRQAIDSL